MLSRLVHAVLGTENRALFMLGKHYLLSSVPSPVLAFLSG